MYIEKKKIYIYIKQKENQKSSGNDVAMRQLIRRATFIN